MTGRLIVVSGPSGVGKSTIVKSLLDELPLEFSVSATSRDARPGEMDGSHFHFSTRLEFEELISEGALLEWVIYNGNYYGTPALPIEQANENGRDVLLDIEIQGARQVRLHRPDALMFFVVPPSMEVLEARLRARGDTSESDIIGRLAIADVELDEAPDLFDYLVTNDVVGRASAEISNLIITSK